jgi:hypothetical protein
MTKQLILVMLLRRRKRPIWYSVWYQRGHKSGWYMGNAERFRHGTHVRLGHNFYQAVEIIASGTLDFLADAKDNKPTHISIALKEPISVCRDGC